LACVIALRGGLPTTIIDIYNTQDISEHGEPPYWTLMLRPMTAGLRLDQDEHAADAIFQVDPIIRSRRLGVPAGVCRTADGVRLSDFDDSRSRSIRRVSRDRLMYQEPPLFAYERAKRAHINYIIVGPPERNANPGVEERFNSIPNQLAPVFKNGSISIYEVR
jgi:hypothetical protein